MHKGVTALLAAGIFAASSQQAAAINIVFDYSYDANNFFDTQAKKDVLQAAGSFFSNLIQDDLTAISSGASGSYTAVFNDPSSGAQVNISDFSVAADTLIVYTGGRALGGSTLGIGGPGGFSVGGTSAFVDNAVTRGETATQDGVQNPTTGPNTGAKTAVDFAPWGGAVTFDTAANWYFDPDVSTSADVMNNDFFSVALHELGHLLGIGTADSWQNLISGSDFTGAASVAEFGGNVPLANTGHWADGTTSTVNGVSQETAMDPSILFGTRKVFTDLDLAGLSDVGWQVSAVPVPAAVWLFGSGLLGLVATARRRS